MKAELFFNAQARLGEGALWHDDRLLWVDIEGCTVNRLDPVTKKNESWNLGQMVGTAVPRASGGLIVAAQKGVGFFDPASGRFQLFAELEPGRPDLRSNDGKCDPRGRLFVGSMGIDKPRPPGALFRVEPDGTFTRVVTGTGVSNGLAWSLDQRTLYFIDTPIHEVSAFDYDVSTGEISNRRTAINFRGGRGRPDGMTIDTDGNLWVAMFDGGGINHCDPRTGRILDRIEVEVSRTTSCAFGGPGLRDLYITSARVETELASGGIFVARPGAQGVRAFSFAG